MNPNNSNSVSVNSDSIFHEEPGFEKAKTLSKILMISRGDYRLFSYLGQQCVYLQYRQLVQTTLSTTQISTCDLGDDSDRVPGFTRPIGQNRPSEYPQITGRVYLQTDPGLYYSKYQKDEAFVGFNHFAKLFKNRMPKPSVFYGFFKLLH